jgi:hypothetical protein
MIGMMNAPSLPPTALADDAPKLCATILAITADPSGTQARLAELSAATATLRSAIDEHAGVVAQAAQVTAREAEAATREQNVLAREQAVANAATAVDVSAAANVARSKSLDDREAQLAARIAEHEAKVKANEEDRPGQGVAAGVILPDALTLAVMVVRIATAVYAALTSVPT